MNLFGVTQLFVAILLILCVIFQSRGNKGGVMFGGSGENFRSKRGIEKILFYSTIVLAAIFALLSILSLISS